MNVKINNLRNITRIELCKINKQVIGEIPIQYLISESYKLDEIPTIELNVPKFIIDPHDKKKIEYITYNEIIEERFIKINNSDYYVIKEIKEDKQKNIKSIKAYAYEKKLEKNNIVLSDVALSLVDTDKSNEIYSFNDELYKQTGWKVGYVDETVRYKEDGNIRVRIQESTDTSFYSFIKETIEEQFCCVADFDRQNKIINFYDINSYGDEVKLILHKDNFIKALEISRNTNNLVTRLTLQGNEEKCIVEDVNPTGTNYIENFSYFIETEEMSKELINALKLYDTLTIERVAKWRELYKEKAALVKDITLKTSNENILIAMIKEYENYIIAHENLEETGKEYDLSNWENQMNIKRDELSELSAEIVKLEQELDKVDKAIKKLNKLIKKETALDNQGNLIFNDMLLDELKEFIYNDTYSEDSFVEGEEILNVGKHLLETKCKPTISYSIDVVDFTQRIISNDTFNDFDLSLGDLIVLYDKSKQKEEYVYFVGWSKSYDFKGNTTLSLDLSNKKTNKTNTKVIADLLKDAKNNKKLICTSKHLLNNQRYNRFDTNLITDVQLDIELDKPILNDKTIVTGVDITLSDIVLGINSSKKLKANVLPLQAKNTNVSWISSDNNVATVSSTGIVKGINYGDCIITVITEEGEFKDTCNVTVQDIENEVIHVSSVQLNVTAMSLNINQQQYLAPVVLPSNATNVSVSYSSNNENVAKVTKEGLVTGVGYGQCEIKVTSNDNDNISARCYINVKNATSQLNILKNILILGDSRIYEMNSLGLLNDSYVDAKENATLEYYSNNFKNYPINPECIVVFPSMHDLSQNGALSVKNLVTDIKSKYPMKNIYLVSLLPVGVNYKSDIIYSEVNNNISKFNSMLRDYANLLNIKMINVNLGITSGNTLNSNYTKDGYYLTETGYKILYNNMINAILDFNNNNNNDNNNVPSKPEYENVNNYRNAIVERALKIVDMCTNGKAWYSQYNRTVDWEKPQVIKYSTETIYSQGVKKTYNQPGVGKIGFDCSSFVGVCYQAAGFDFMKGLSCAGRTLQEMAKKHNAKVWRYADSGFDEARPGDIVMFANDSATVTKSNMFTVTTHHTAIYMGNGYIAEAIGYGSGIKKRKRTPNNKWFFMRINELVENDKLVDGSITNSTNCLDVNGVIDGNKYIYKFNNARITAFGWHPESASGIPLEVGKTVGSFNMPYGTKIYIPALKGKFGNETGIVTVVDTGIGGTDFDLFLDEESDSEAEKKMGAAMRADAYVLEFGNKGLAWSYTESYKWAYEHDRLHLYKNNFKNYMEFGGTLINFYKFKDHDRDIKNTIYWQILTSEEV